MYLLAATGTAGHISSNILDLLPLLSTNTPRSAEEQKTISLTSHYIHIHKYIRRQLYKFIFEHIFQTPSYHLSDTISLLDKYSAKIPHVL